MKPAKKIVKKIIKEATSDEVIEKLTEQAIDAGLGAVSFDAIRQDYTEAQRKYYTAIRDCICKELGVSTNKIGHYITNPMKVAFAKVWEDKVNEMETQVNSADSDEDNEEQQSTELLVED